MKKLIILGSTGSIGTNTLRIVSEYPDKFEVIGLSAGANVIRMTEQIRQFRPRIVSMASDEAAGELRDRCVEFGTVILSGPDAAAEVAAYPEGDLVVSGIVGAAGLLPTLSAIRSGKDIALANKETMVMAGQLIRDAVARHKVCLLPVDSEHSAVFQSLAGHHREDVLRVILTASGGPFFNLPLSQRRDVSPQDAVKHPNWDMGQKISVDSATLMNKGLEVIEARWLFDIPPEKIDVVIHPQSIIHSMVEYVDGAVMAQMSMPDMRGPIAYALNYPERLPLKVPRLDPAEVGTLSFLRPQHREFPCLGLAYEALRSGGSMPAVLNAANEEAVSAFLAGRIGFLDIPVVTEKTMQWHQPHGVSCTDDVLNADRDARREAGRLIQDLAASSVSSQRPVT